MAVQIPEPGTGNGQTGDNEYVFRKKVKDNFSTPSNAASRVVGENTNNVMQVGAFGLGVNATPSFLNAGGSTINHFFSSNPSELPPQWAATENMGGWVVNRGGRPLAFAFGNREELFVSRHSGTEWGPLSRIYNDKSTAIYTTTTAAGANVVIEASGRLARSTSSERYKDILADLELDDDAYNNAMQLAPIVYRSTADADNPDYHHYSFSAEALGAYDPAFTLWRENETVTDDAGNTTEQPLAEKVAEGINLNAIVAFLHATNVKQGKLIADLEQRLSVLEPTAEV